MSKFKVGDKLEGDSFPQWGVITLIKLLTKGEFAGMWDVKNETGWSGIFSVGELEEMKHVAEKVDTMKFKVGDRVRKNTPSNRMGPKGLTEDTVTGCTDNTVYLKESFWQFPDELELVETEKVAVVPPHGGPSKYYDFPFSEWVTSNDQMEYFATSKWLQYSLHLKDVFKACCRWGDKEGTSLEYDARKIVYSGLRLLMMIKGKKVVQKYLKELVEDQQFKG